MKLPTRTLIRLFSQAFTEPISGVEVGVWKGKNAEHMLRAMPGLKLWCVDWWRLAGEESSRFYRTRINRRESTPDLAMVEALERLAKFDGRAFVKRMPSVEAAAEFRDLGSQFDFVFLDACHEYQHVVLDIAAWLPVVRPGGILAGHDYNGNGDKRGLFGVKRAVDERFGPRVTVSPGLIWWITVNEADHASVS